MQRKKTVKRKKPVRRTKQKTLVNLSDAQLDALGSLVAKQLDYDRLIEAVVDNLVGSDDLYKNVTAKVETELKKPARMKAILTDVVEQISTYGEFYEDLGARLDTALSAAIKRLVERNLQ